MSLLNLKKFKLHDLFLTLIFNSLIKDEKDRPKYAKLLTHPFIQRAERSHTDVAAYITDILESMANNGITPFTTNQPAECWYN